MLSESFSSLQLHSSKCGKGKEERKYNNEQQTKKKKREKKKIELKSKVKVTIKSLALLPLLIPLYSFSAIYCKNVCINLLFPSRRRN